MMQANTYLSAAQNLHSMSILAYDFNSTLMTQPDDNDVGSSVNDDSGDRRCTALLPQIQPGRLETRLKTTHLSAAA